MKGGIAVDPDSGLEHSAHVYQDGDDKYTVVLGLTDIQSGRNSYYKLQLLESDSRNSYWLFRSWGRIGTTIGGEYLLYNTSQNALKTHVFIFFLLSPITVSFQLEIANFLKFLFTRLYPLLHFFSWFLRLLSMILLFPLHVLTNVNCLFCLDDLY